MTNILIFIIILHLIVGFGFMLWKLNGPVNEDDYQNKDN
jgi:hypothetical protein